MNENRFLGEGRAVVGRVDLRALYATQSWSRLQPRFVIPCLVSEHTKNHALPELLFTAIHELGHVFNLQHVAEPSFMARSALRPTPFPKGVLAFIPQHEVLLSQCSTSPFIWPGGSAFGDLGPLAMANANSTARSAPFGLGIHLDMAQREFWSFEPVELDVAVEITGESQKSVRVPDMIDPGYGEFSIWIEEPDGERRRYRSPRHYCRRDAKITVTRDRPFQRDISIFGESGGHTFRKGGVHRVYADFDVPQKGVLRSNVLEVNVLPASPGNAYYEGARSCFMSRQLGLLMYHRSFIGRFPRGIHRLRDFCEQYEQHAAIGMARYALGRALAKQILEAETGSATNRIRREISQHLSSAIKSSSLSDHRRIIAERQIRAFE